MVFCPFPRTQGKAFSLILWREAQVRGRGSMGQQVEREVGTVPHKLCLGPQGS